MGELGISPEVSDETSDMPSSGSGSGRASASTSGRIADEAAEAVSTFWRFEGRKEDSSYSCASSSSYGSDEPMDESGESGGE